MSYFEAYCSTKNLVFSYCRDQMDKDEPFIYNEVDYKTPKQSPQSSQTWPMDKIRRSRFQQKMTSLLSPATPKRNYSISNAKSLLLQCLRDSKSDPLPRRRFPASYSDEGVLMDGVLVTSATGKKASYSVPRSQHKNTEFSSPRSEPGRNQETTRSQHSSGGKEKMLANSPCTKVETPKAANPSKLQATAKPFILTPRSSQILTCPVPIQQLPYDHDPHFQWGDPLPLTPPSYAHPYLPQRHTYPRPLHGPSVPYLQSPASPHYLARFPRPTGYQMPHDFNQSPTPRISLPTTPSSSQANTNTSEPPVHTPIYPAASLSTSTTTHGKKLDLPSSPADGLEKRAKKPDLSPTSDEPETMAQKPDLSPSDGLETVTKKQDLSPFGGLGTMKTEKDWSPSDDGLPTFTQAQTDFMESQNRVLPDDVFEHYEYRKRLPVFTQLCLVYNLPPQTKPQEDQ